MSPLRLHYAPDNASLCVRLALHRAEVPFQTILLDRRTREQDGAAYRAVNPMGLIPALETPDGPLFETGAILLWIADRYGAGLAPAPDHSDRGRFLSWLFWMSNTLHPALRILFYPGKHISGDTGPLVARTRDRFLAWLHMLEAEAPGLRSWLGAERSSILDCYLAPMLRWPSLYPEVGASWFDLAAWPCLYAVAQAMDIRPETVEAIRAEGLGPSPFSAPILPDPPEGSPT